MPEKYKDYYGGATNSQYYTSYYENEANEERPKLSEAHVYERKNGYIKIYNGHIGTFAWEKEWEKGWEREDDTKTT